MVEDLARRVVRLVGFGAADVEVELEGRRVDGARPRGSGHSRLDTERLTVAHALGHHEVDLVFVVQGLAVEGGVAPSPPGHVEDALRPVGVPQPESPCSKSQAATPPS